MRVRFVRSTVKMTSHSIACCRSCGKPFRQSLRKCPTCGVRSHTPHSNEPERDVSGVFLFLFGFFYLQYKGWYKAAIIHALLCFCLMGTFWFAIPFYAKKFVDSAEGLTTT
jgi:predicted amidophosphoribosyltransferase